MLRALILTLVLALPARADVPFRMPADPATAAFVASNVTAILYHEVAHALIDVLALPVPGNEEDAADTLSALLIDRLWAEEDARRLVAQNALAYRLYAGEAGRKGYDLTFWGQHSLDQQRYDRLVCLFFGADPVGRSALADSLGLPQARRAACPDEFALAAKSWGAMLEGLPPQDHGRGLRMVVPQDRDALTALVAAEVAILNAEYGLPVWVDVTVERCGEANAFYDLRARRIVVCTEYAKDLVRLHATRPAPPESGNP